MWRLLVIMIFFVQSLFAQNLVPNPSFEDYSLCPNNSGQISNSRDWQNGTTFSTCEYYNSCSPDNIVGVPSNGNGNNFQYAHFGNAYIGLLASKQFSAFNVREFAKVELLGSLVANERYFFKMFINLSNHSGNCVATLGAYFSVNDTLFTDNFLLNTVPNVESDKSVCFCDSLAWMPIFGSFVARGAETFLIVGNFKDDNNSNLRLSGFGSGDIAYYLIDDVCVSANPADCGIDTTGMFLSVEGVDKETINIYPNPTQDKLYIQSEAHLVSYYTIADIAGNVVQQGDIVAHQISVGDLAKGVYFVRLQGRDGAVYVRKMLKE